MPSMEGWGCQRVCRRWRKCRKTHISYHHWLQKYSSLMRRRVVFFQVAFKNYSRKKLKCRSRNTPNRIQEKRNASETNAALWWKSIYKCESFIDFEAMPGMELKQIWKHHRFMNTIKCLLFVQGFNMCGYPESRRLSKPHCPCASGAGPWMWWVHVVCLAATK